MKTKPDLGFWSLWNLSFGFFGVQIAYALQSANVSRIFATIGADPHDLSYFWILPPLMGLIVQPIVGSLSDRTWNRFGRRLPYLIVGALVAILVMCLLPNAGSFGLGISSAIIVGLIALMLLDTSINMAMQPFKMLVGDMVNEKQKGLAYSIQSFLCNSGSVIGFVFPFVLAWIGIKSVAPTGVVPDSVIWSFYLGAAILGLCVVYSLIKIKEWPPKVYEEYNGSPAKTDATKKKQGVISLLKNAPSTFWTVSLVQFFCWFAFLFMWTYTTGTVATNAFDTPVADKIDVITDGKTSLGDKLILVGDQVIVENGKALMSGVMHGKQHLAAATIVTSSGDTLVKDHHIQYSDLGPKAAMGQPIAKKGETITLDGQPIALNEDAVLVDFLPTLSGIVTLSSGKSVAVDKTTGKTEIMERQDAQINASQASYSTHADLDTATKQYNDAADWVGILFAVQAMGSVLWAVVLPKLRSRKFSYSLSLLLGAVGFVLAGLITDKYLLFVPFLLIGCAWAAMLAWPFTILTNSLKGGNIGTYLGLFNGSICLPQIVAALTGGLILSLFSTPGMLAPQYVMMIVAGISLAIGALCVGIIRETPKDDTPVQEAIPESENI